MQSPARPIWRDELIDGLSSGVEPEMAACPDRDLVIRAKNDRLAFTPLYRRYAQPVHRYCYRRLGERTAAEDATSQVFARAIVSLPNYRDQDGGSFRGWLFTIAHHVVTDALRQRRPTVSLDLAADVVDQSLGPEEVVLAGDRAATVQDLLRMLPPAERAVIELRLAGLNGAEIATVLGRSRNAVDVAHSRALTRLKRVLGRQMPEVGNDRARG